MTQACETCRFWYGSSTTEYGHCHRRAPSPFYARDAADDLVDYLGWPLSAAYDWCGEYEPGHYGKPPLVGPSS